MAALSWARRSGCTYRSAFLQPSHCAVAAVPQLKGGGGQWRKQYRSLALQCHKGMRGPTQVCSRSSIAQPEPAAQCSTPLTGAAPHPPHFAQMRWRQTHPAYLSLHLQEQAPRLHARPCWPCLAGKGESGRKPKRPRRNLLPRPIPPPAWPRPEVFQLQLAESRLGQHHPYLSCAGQTGCSALSILSSSCTVARSTRLGTCKPPPSLPEGGGRARWGEGHHCSRSASFEVGQKARTPIPARPPLHPEGQSGYAILAWCCPCMPTPLLV
mmetsp:Transcript_8120/g.21494  ORF Transcript_8120/g.21494 Transcript_8120/m.21494 type:complete len:268 (-) Transcript_8120:1390-2193(-)